MIMLFVDEQGTDIPVVIVEQIDEHKVKVKSKIGHPFGCVPVPGKIVHRCTKNFKIVERDEIKELRWQNKSK